MFSGFLTISSFDFNRIGLKLLDMFFGTVPMFILKDFARRRYIAQICANSGAHAHFGATHVWEQGHLYPVALSSLYRTFKNNISK